MQNHLIIPTFWYRILAYKTLLDRTNVLDDYLNSHWYNSIFLGVYIFVLSVSIVHVSNIVFKFVSGVISGSWVNCATNVLKYKHKNSTSTSQTN